MENNSYVYQHRCIATNEIFYVGIGTYTKNDKYLRAKSKNGRNIIWHKYINKHGDFSFEILHDEISRADACRVEIELIKLLGRIVDKTGRLTNISFGGEKTFEGLIRTQEWCRRISEGQTGKKMSLEARANMSKARAGVPTGRKGFKMSDEQKKKLSESCKKNPTNYWKGKKRSLETRKKISETQMGKKNKRPNYVITNETRDKMSKTLTGRKLPQEVVEKIRLKSIGNKSRTGQKLSEETKQKMKISQLLRWKLSKEMNVTANKI